MSVDAQKPFAWDDKVILIAEDERINYVLLKSVFEKSNATVIWAQDGEEAVEAFRSNEHIDLVILDYMMPKMDGLEAAKCIKQQQDSVPVIFQSANFLSKEMLESVSYDNIAYFRRPINPFQILSKAEELLKK